MRHRRLAALLLAGLPLFSVGAADLISVKDAVTRSRLPPDHRFHYGPHPFQFGDLRVPRGAGPHPVAVLIHGGCWRARYDLHLMDAMARHLTEIGYATWNLEFRRHGHDSGGWPGTFQDVLLGSRHLVSLATEFALDLDAVVLVGHSSGGHLALWLAGQAPADQNPVFAGNPLRIQAVVALAPVADLLAVEAQPGLGCHDVVAAFMGGASGDYSARYRMASPAQMPHIPIPQVLVAGGRDPVIPPAHIRHYETRASERGDNVRMLQIASAGHFELITPGASGWPDVEQTILSFSPSLAGD